MSPIILRRTIKAIINHLMKLYVSKCPFNYMINLSFLFCRHDFNINERTFLLDGREKLPTGLIVSIELLKILAFTIASIIYLLTKEKNKVDFRFQKYKSR